MSRKSTTTYCFLIVLIICLFFGALFLLPKRQENSAQEEIDQFQSQKYKDDREGDGQNISHSAVERFYKQNSEQMDTEETLPVAAERTLKHYQQRSDCLLVYSGYLDLMGNVWCCLVNGGNWSELVTISDQGDTRRVAICHISAQDTKNLLEQSN